MTLYRIKDWDAHFENNKSRERERCSFCCIPNKQDGLGYGMIMREPDGPAIYGAFVAVVLMHSKLKKRTGYLTADGVPAGCPLSARQVSIKTQVPEQVVQRMFEVVCRPDVGWMEQVTEECPPTAQQVPAECPPSALEGKEGKEVEGSESTPPDSEQPSMEEVMKEAELRGYPAQSAEKFFLHYEGNGYWLNKFGKPVKWRQLLNSWVLTDRQKATPEPKRRNRGPNI